MSVNNKYITKKEISTKKVAQDILGKLLVRVYKNKKYFGIITETEAYCGPNDLASHASRGRTPRTELMFGPPDHLYIYLIYGMYYCLNIVTEKEGYPAAVLIRGVQAFEPISVKQKIDLTKLTPLEYKKTNGPGKLCRYFQIDKTLNGKKIPNDKIWIENSGLKPAKISRLPRVGIDYAKEYKDKPWRYLCTEFKK